MEGALQHVVGRNLKRVRRELGYSQESFGEHIGWHRTFVGAVERGERNLTLRTVERLSDQLDVDPMDLLWDHEALAASLGDDGAPIFTRRAVRGDAWAAEGQRRGAQGTPASRRSRPDPG